MHWLSWHGLVVLVGANSAPVVVAWLARDHVARPLDGGLRLADGERLLGAHKTWRGLVAAMLAASVIGGVCGFGFWPGALAGTAAIAGDSLSSFIKRRMRRRPGAFVPGLDQIPEAALPLWTLWRTLELDWPRFLVTMAVFCVLDLAACRLIGSSRRQCGRSATTPTERPMDRQ